MSGSWASWPGAFVNFARLHGSDVDIWMGTLSKSLAGCGGYICGCSGRWSRSLTFLAPGFLYSVGMPPRWRLPALAALQVMLDEPERLARLHHISSYFLQRAQAMGLDTGTSIGLAVVPVILGSSVLAARLSDALFQRGINVQPILHPAVPEKSARLRFFFSCDHTEAQIDQALEALKSELAKLNQ